MSKRASSRAVPRTSQVPKDGIVALVLAAGTSSRFGRPKPLARLGDRPLLARCLDSLRASRVRAIVVVLGTDADRIRHEVPLEGTQVVVNPDPSEGMSSSIRAGLRAAPPDALGFLVVLGDQPLLTPVTIDALVGRHGAKGARAVVPTYRGMRGNPVLLDRSLAPDMEAVRGDVGCRSVLAAHASEVVELPVDDPGILLDVDTPRDLERLDEALRAGTPLERLLPR